MKTGPGATISFISDGRENNYYYALVVIITDENELNSEGTGQK